MASILSYSRSRFEQIYEHLFVHIIFLCNNGTTLGRAASRPFNRGGQLSHGQVLQKCIVQPMINSLILLISANHFSVFWVLKDWWSRRHLSHRCFSSRSVSIVDISLNHSLPENSVTAMGLLSCWWKSCVDLWLSIFDTVLDGELCPMEIAISA